MDTNRTDLPRLLLLLAVLIAGSLFIAPTGAPQPAVAAPKPTRTPTPIPTPTPTASPTPAPGCTPAGNVVPSPNSGVTSALNGVATVSANDAWAVGGAFGGLTLIERWDGTRWNIVPSPNSDAGNNALDGVAAVSANDVWAVGTSGGVGGPDWQALIEHWNGTNWSIVPGPKVGATSKLHAVAAVAANDVWAVGSYSDPATNWWDQTLVLHWDGTRWTRVSSPSLGTTSELHGVAAVSRDNIWAVGFDLESNWRTLILHWDGTTWSRVPSPNVGSLGNYLYDVFALSADNIWAVGSYDNGAHTLILHWNGTNWSIVPSPNVNANYNQLLGVAAGAANDIWAVGYSTVVVWVGEYEEFYDDALVLHWNGTSWSIVPNPLPPSSTNSQLHGVAAVAAGDVWTVGWDADTDSGSQMTLIERFGCQ